MLGRAADVARYLLDTHALLWWLAGSDRLSATAMEAIADPRSEILVSAASAWEVATKYRIGRLPGGAALATDFVSRVVAQGFVLVDITAADGQRAGLLPGAHRDPFDRMLAAQALRLGVALVSADPALDGFGARRIW